MAKYKIYAGSVNGPEFIGGFECENEEKALELAYEFAIEDYESYEGLHGLQTLEEIAEEYDLDPDSEEAMDAYRDARESWLDFRVEEVY